MGSGMAEIEIAVAVREKATKLVSEMRALRKLVSDSRSVAEKAQRDWGEKIDESKKILSILKINEEDLELLKSLVDERDLYFCAGRLGSD